MTCYNCEVLSLTAIILLASRLEMDLLIQLVRRLQPPKLPLTIWICGSSRRGFGRPLSAYFASSLSLVPNWRHSRVCVQSSFAERPNNLTCFLGTVLVNCMRNLEVGWDALGSIKTRELILRTCAIFFPGCPNPKTSLQSLAILA